MIKKHAVFKCDSNSKGVYYILFEHAGKLFVEYGRGICPGNTPDDIVNYIRTNAFNNTGCVTTNTDHDPEAFYDTSVATCRADGVRPINGGLSVEPTC